MAKPTMKQRLLLYVLCLVAFAVLLIPKGMCDNETAVNVSFQILTGSGSSDYYSGDYFWYNVTLQNSGTTVINATFTVTVLNTTGGVMGETPFIRNLEPNETTYLYPNYTRLGKDEVYIYFMDTVGTYTIELTSSLPMYYYRWYGETGRYTVQTNLCTLNLDAMPSYQKAQNDLWNQYVQQSESYMNQVQTYIAQSRAETSRTYLVAEISLLFAFVAIMVNVIGLPKTRLEQHKKLIFFITLALFVILYLVFFLL